MESNLPRLIDNNRNTLAGVLRTIAPSHKHLSIATGYWDLAGTLEIIEQIKNYDSIRLLIGQEPISHRRQKQLNLDPNSTENLFPDSDIQYDLEVLAGKDKPHIPQEEQISQLRNCAKTLSDLIKNKKLEVKVFRQPFLHAKVYIFGNFQSNDAVGIVGSSNFTQSGLTKNAELNAVETDYRVISFKPQDEKQENGHLSWYEQMWNDANAQDWTGDFTKIIRQSPLGDMTFGAYDVYIKTLMEVFPDELAPKPKLGQDIQDVLYDFQNRNAGILINKLEKMGLAMLSDSVGLGKTITAGAIIKEYLTNKNASRIIIIVPASLKKQWTDDLGIRFSLKEDIDFKIISMQDLGAIDDLIEQGGKTWMKNNPVDLFIVDEAHNLRTIGSARYQKILDLFLNNLKSKVLLLTATPINNSLNDFVNQIQLALKGNFDSISVDYKRGDGNILKMDFFKAIKEIQSRIRKAEKEGIKLSEQNWTDIRQTIGSGLRHYLVRSTRQGVEKEGSVRSKDGKILKFPKSIVEQIEYKYDEKITKFVNSEICKSIKDFEDIDPRQINLNLFAEFTQQSQHPLDFIPKILENENSIETLFDVSPDELQKTGNFKIADYYSVVPNIFQVVMLLGWTPYRPEAYRRKIYGKPISEIRNLPTDDENEMRLIRTQLILHNMLHITWLKRLESSSAALLKSVQYYKTRIELFEKYLNQGYIVSIGEALTLDEYGEDIEKAFDDYDDYIKEIQKVLESGGNPDEIKKLGVQRKEADDKKYNIESIKKDIARDKKILSVLINILTQTAKPENNSKLKVFVHSLQEMLKSKKHGKKILVFSFFADTINYIRDNLPKLIKDIPDFSKRAQFLSGQSKDIDGVVGRFAPKAKKYELKKGDDELDFLFATDILSEGQNLQDSAMLINFDLHWNPVRMIQRNGRINRLGSSFEEVLIKNMKPEENLELYLNLVRRLERKIETIKHSVGLDQGVLSNQDINPIEFVEEFSKIYSKDKKAASAALKDIADESENDILSWTEDFIYDLRGFLAANKENQQEIERIKQIPLGKWNYFPKDNKNKINNSVLALSRASGKTSITQQPIIETYFSLINTDGNYPSQYIDDSKALAMLKTSADDNSAQIDKISIDRMRVLRRSQDTARTQSEGGGNKFEFKPKQSEAIQTLSRIEKFDGIDIVGQMQRNIVNSKQERQIKKILFDINKEIKESGNIYASTISEFERFFNEMLKNPIEDKEIDKIEGVLFYADR